MLWAWASLLIRSGLILLAAEVLRRLSHRSTAGNRYRIILAAFTLLLIWPVFSAMVPEIHIPLSLRPPAGAMVTIQQTSSLLDRKVSRANTLNWPLMIWLAGVLLALIPVAVSYINVRRLVRRAAPLHEAGWRDLLEEECPKGSKQPQLLTYAGPVMPFTFGLRSPRILLPASCGAWQPLRRRTVLLHELAHIRRRDLLWQLLANIATALWWFQPLCWTSRWTLRRESEQACDALVLEAGIRPSEYASELLEIARSFTKGQRWSSAAIAVARRGELEGRMYAILDPAPKSRRKRPLAAIAALTALALTASAVTVLPEQNNSPGGHSMRRTLISGLLVSAGLSAATIGGSVFDPGGAAIPNAQASLYNPDTSAKQETTTGSDGKFTFESLAAGSYILHVEKAGFASLYREFNVQQDSDVQRGLVLKVASPAAQKSSDTNTTRVAEAQPLNPKLLRVRGAFEENKLINKVQPVYPAAAKAAGVQGTVELDVVISKEGVPEDIRVLSSPDDDLTQSALDAVRLWRYSPTLLNGEPVEILTEVIVNYTLSK